ncbi:MAG TPA: glycosyltransferase family 4 protein [Isosphaeraceae bacterium]|nr:glycosyltransferase family 4 protein [Isosphaeraceae bacterium]
MRVAVLSRSNRVVGGVEEYLRRFLVAAADSGNEVGFWYETSEGPPDRSAIPDPPAGGWSIAELGRAAALEALRRWRPEVIYAHGTGSPDLEEAAYGIAPAVFFAHVYVGTCISGARTTWLPVASPCDRRFGPACLAHYFPRRCGGLNPVTMLRQYRLQAERLAAIRRCAAVVTHSEHMRDEYVRHGIPADRVFRFPFYVSESIPEQQPARPLGSRPTLLFLGRMEAPKGGDVLLEALPRVRAALGRPLRVVFAGDGRERVGWEARAASLQAHDPGLRIEFTGWVDAGRRSALFRASDLLVVPSIWPEPFGQVGPEAGLYGVPVAAFAVGGTPSWLTDGANGRLAPGDPPRAAGLADSIVGCLADPAVHQRLRAGASRLAGRFTWANHYAPLMAVFTRFAGGGGQSG